MKKLILVIMILLVSMMLYSYEAVDFKSDEFKTISNAFSAQARAGSYRQTKSFSGSPRKLVSSGIVTIAPSKGIIWNMNKPYKSMLAVGKNTLVQQVRDSAPVIMDVNGNLVFLTIAQCMDSLFCGEFEMLEKLFDTSCRIQDGKWALKLLPKDKTIASFMTQILVTGSESIESLLLNEKTGDSILYEFEELQIKELTDEEFSVFEIR